MLYYFPRTLGVLRTGLYSIHLVGADLLLFLRLWYQEGCWLSTEVQRAGPFSL
jgi:hypothetical protein